jgi:predicted enzyme related to lactoylglutathione lyase
MPARARLAAVIVQCRDPETLAEFWCQLLDLTVSERLGDPVHFVDCTAVTPGADGPYLGFERVSEWQPGSRLHLDLEPDDVEATTSWIEANGGSRCSSEDVSEHGESWRVMRDPEGNEFCLWLS